jgi:capsular exopolysaccharide synthesis family protein
MQFLPKSESEDRNKSLAPAPIANCDLYELPPPTAPVNAPAEGGIDPVKILSKYWLLAVALLAVGVAGGFMSVVLSTPVYRSRLMLEIQDANGNLPRNAAYGSGISYEENEVNIETQIGILRSASFLKKGADRMESDNLPLAPTRTDLFSRLRQRIHPATRDPIEAESKGINVAIETFTATPVTHTRLIELSCESTSPDVAAQFLNSMAAEFSEYGNSSRIQTAQKTSQWLEQKIEETQANVHEAEDRVKQFMAQSGNVFAGQDTTLEDTKLAELKGSLAKIQAERIARQTRYELTQKNSPESLAEVLDDPTLRGYQGQLEDLKKQKAAIEALYTSKYTSKYEKVRQIDAQIALIQKAYQNEINSIIDRTKNDYQASLRQERLLQGAYAAEAQQVGSEIGKLTEYNNLKHDAETQRQEYQTLLGQLNEANLSSSVPVNPVRVVEAAVPPAVPYTPRPLLNISFGAMFGMVIASGIAFLRERMDRSIRSPGSSQQLFNAPELGVIPNFAQNGEIALKPGGRGSKVSSLIGPHADSTTALVTWESRPAFVAESFRGTLASILRNQATGKDKKLILITSPGPSEGKTTVVQNLGIALAETGRRVLLLDADFRRPHLHRKFSLPNEWGLIDLLCEDRPLSEYEPERLGVFTGLPGLWVLPNRVTQNNVSKALYSPRLRTIIELLAKRYDMVLVDAPPLLSIADTRIIAPLTDALILVLRSGVTNRDDALEAYQKIRQDGLTLLGTVLTDYNFNSDRRRQYYYDYGSQS